VFPCTTRRRTLTILGLLAALAVCIAVISSVSAPAQVSAEVSTQPTSGTPAQPRPPVPWHEAVTASPTGPAVPVAKLAAAMYEDVAALPAVPTAVALGESVLPVEPASAPSLSAVSSLSSDPASVTVGSVGTAIPSESVTANAGVGAADLARSGVSGDVTKIPSAARASAWQPWWESFATTETDIANTTAMLLACDDEPALRKHLLNEGFALRLPGGSGQPGGPGEPASPGEPSSPTRPLPQNFLVGVTAYEYADAYCQADQDLLENVAPPGGATSSGTTPGGTMATGVTVLRFVNRSDAAVRFALANPEREFLVITDLNGLSIDALRVLAGANVVGVIVGHYRHADDEPMDFATAADDVLRVTRAVRLVSDAPVLLAVGAVNIHTRDTERSWADAFGDDLHAFDGFALYGLARFPAILEAAENPRELIVRRMGLPNRPCILIEFVGTSFQYAAADREYVERVWAARAKPLIAALRKQQWRGLITWSATTDDARIKADALRNAVQAQPSEPSR